MNVLLVDDHQIVIDGLKALIDQYPGEMTIVGEAHNGNQVLALLTKVKVDLIFLDIHMPQMDGIEAASEVKRRWPATKIIALTMHDNDFYVKQMIEVGVDGYILKNAGKEILFSAIEIVMRGDRFFDPQAMDKLVISLRRGPVGDNVKITKREMEVLKCIAMEQTTNEISEKLFISTHTVETHRKNLLSKLQVKNTAGLVKYAIKIGLI